MVRLPCSPGDIIRLLGSNKDVALPLCLAQVVALLPSLAEDVAPPLCSAEDITPLHGPIKVILPPERSSLSTLASLSLSLPPLALLQLLLQVPLTGGASRGVLSQPPRGSSIPDHRFPCRTSSSVSLIYFVIPMCYFPCLNSALFKFSCKFSHYIKSGYVCVSQFLHLF